MRDESKPDAAVSVHPAAGIEKGRFAGVRESRPALAHVILFFAAYVAGAGLADWLAIIPGTGISLWPPAGVFLATLLLNDRRTWPWWILTGLCAELTANALWFHNPLFVATILNVGNALHAATGACLVAIFCTRPFYIRTLRDLLVLVLLGAGVASATSALIGATTLVLSEGQPFMRAWPLWWIGDATGVLMLAPAVLVAVQDWRSHPRFSNARLIEAALLGVLLAVVAVLSLGGFFPFAYIMMPALLWVAVRFELRGAAVASVLLAVMTAAFTVRGVSPFTGDADTQQHKHMMLQLFLAISSLSVWVVGVIARQRRVALRALRVANAELEARVAERTASLRESERRLAAVMDALPIGVALENTSGETILGNAAYRNYVPTVVPSRDDERHGLWEAYASDGTRLERKDYPAARALRGERVWPGQEFLYHGDQERGPAWTRVAAVPFRGEDGTITSAIVVIDDIDQEKRTKDALAGAAELLSRERQRLAIALRTGRLGVFELNVDGSAVWWSEEAYALFGVDPASFVPSAESLGRLIHPEDRDEFRRMTKERLARRAVFTHEYRIVRPDGAVRCILTQSQVRRDEAANVDRVTGVVMDVTESKAANERIRENEIRFRTLADTMPALVFIADADGRTSYVNPQFRDYGGGPADASPGASWLDVLDDEERSRAAVAWEAKRSAAETYEGEHRFRSPAGVSRWFLCRVTPLRGEEGRVVQWVGVCVDLQEVVAAREALARINDELELRVTERTAALRQANARLATEMERREAMQAKLVQSQKLEAIGTLTSGIAHDFNNAIAAIAGGFSLIERRTADPRLLEITRHGINASERVSALIRQLLAFARRQVLEPKIVDLRDLFSESETLLRRAIGVGVSLTVDCPDRLPLVRIDPVQLEMALINLAANSCDAMPDGGTLRVTVRACPAQEAGRPPELGDADAVLIAVADTGCGIPPELLQRVVEPFFTTKPAAKGTGLGLAMVHGFVHQSGGTLRIESRLGEGTTVLLYLPQAGEFRIERDDHRIPIAPTGIGRHVGATILLVDDDRDVCAVTAAHLRDLGYLVLEANTAEAALDVSRAQPIDMVLCDVVMPGTKGRHSRRCCACIDPAFRFSS